MEPNYCQSCGMPLVNETDFGTNQDNGESYSKEEALARMQYYFPQLKRWKKA